MHRRSLLLAPAFAALPRFIRTAAAATPGAAGVLSVAYAGSMAVVMDRALGPGFAKATGAHYQGMAQGSFGLAHLIAAGTLRPDVFISVTAGPIRLVQKAKKAGAAVPVSSTEMVIAYPKDGRYAAALARHVPWWKALEQPGLRFGRTDPRIDPQGRNIIFTMRLAERYYHAPGLAQRVLGPVSNPTEIFTEPSLLSRLEAGQIDAASGYRSSTASHGLPMVLLPPQINLSDPAMDAAWYSKVSLTLKGKTMRPEPLVFYATVPTDAPNPELARKFVAYLASPQGQAVFRAHGYSPPHGDPLAPA